MEIITWLILGALAGWFASMIMKTDASQGLRDDVILGVLGAFVGGFVMNLLGQPGVSGLNIYSMVVAVIGAIILIAVGRMFRRSV